MNKKYTPPRSAAISLISILTAAIIILFIGAKIILNKIFFYIAAVILTLIEIFIGIYIPLLMKNISVCIDENEVVLKSGIIISCERRLRISRLELIYVIKTPFSKYTGLNFTVLCVYGKRLILPFMKSTDSKEIIDNLSDIMNKKHEGSMP